MKKFAAVVSVAVLFAFAAPVFAATNPFMDVPMNHWAYDAIGQLAAHGILSGYPDGTYKGKQPTTRYEMASALARALAVVDMTKASKQDVEMLKKLIVEFKDELDALGVKVDGIDKRLAVIEDRLGGWKLSGQLRLDIENADNDAPEADNGVTLSRARITFERWFGDPERPIHFKAILRGDDGDGRQDNLQNWKQFYAEIPFYWDSMLTAGRFSWGLEEHYYVTGDGTFAEFDETGGYVGLAGYLSGRDLDALGWSKTFGLGSVKAYVAHDPNVRSFRSDDLEELEPPLFDSNGNRINKRVDPYGAWEFAIKAELQFNEQFGLDLGAQAFWGDNAEPRAQSVPPAPSLYNPDELKFDSLWTIFAGLRFNFNDNVAFRGIYYHQKIDVERWTLADPAIPGDVDHWANAFPGIPGTLADDPNAWKLILDVKQEALKFTSLWLEYGQVDQNFTAPKGIDDGNGVFAYNYDWMRNVMPWDLTYFRVAAGQKWNDDWATHLFYYSYNFDQNDQPDGNRFDLVEWGLGVQYIYNANVKFGLNYLKADYKEKADRNGVVRTARDDEHKFIFRTAVSF